MCAALAASVPLVCFLTAVIWLADVADRCGSRGSVATLLVRDLAGRRFSAVIGEGYMRLWPATATVAAMAATALIWLTVTPSG